VQYEYIEMTEGHLVKSFLEHLCKVKLHILHLALVLTHLGLSPLAN